MEPLIESVRRYPCLWNTSAIEYRDQELKDAAWAEVMKDTDLSSVKEVKMKWKKLRDSYRDALKRQSETAARDGGAGHKRPYPWRYMGLMGFLQPHMGARKRAEAERAEAERAEAERAEAERVELGLAAPAPAAPPANGTSAARDSDSDSSSSESGQSSPAPAAKRRALADISRKLSYLCRREPPAASAPPAAPPSADPLDIFFSSMCQATKRLGFGAQLKVKRALFEAVAAAEEALLAEQASLAALWARAPSSASEDDAPAPGPGPGPGPPAP